MTTQTLHPFAFLIIETLISRTSLYGLLRILSRSQLPSIHCIWRPSIRLCIPRATFIGPSSTLTTSSAAGASCSFGGGRAVVSRGHGLLCAK
ncbi:unnamed protein product [Somion occarium]|uniref:Uncharacterized protein n=1 Tax=Somion occarium TaxID=3059160 RepID=A0ABP1CXK7_9APHY